MGGGGFMADRRSPLDDFMLSLSSAARPRVCFLPTPSGDSDRAIAAFFEAFAARDCEPSCVRLFGIPERPAEQLADEDVIYVSGGNTANALAIWRLHGVDVALRAAWERGAVLGGVSAGANCWFECCVTDSFGVALDPLDDGLGLLPGKLLPALRRRGAQAARVPRRSSTADSRPATPRTTARPSTSTAPSCARWSPRTPAPTGYRVEPGARDGAPRAPPLSRPRFLRSL